MKISSLQENLKQGLFLVNHVAGKNLNLPILNNILIEARDGNIKLIATNLEIGIVSTIRGKIEEEGSYTVDSKIISDFIFLLPNKKIDLKQKENSLFIEAENNRTKISGQGAEEFPLIPSIEKRDFYSVNIQEFKKALSQVVFAVANSETRVELSGVLFNFSKDKLILVATDSYRLAEKKVLLKKESSKEEKAAIVPAKTIQEIIRVLSNLKDGDSESEDEIKFYITENQIMFSIDPTELVSRLIEGQYPDYKQIIPGLGKTNIIANKNELIRAVKIASLFSKTGINDVNLDFPKGKNRIVVSSASGQSGENITEVEAMVDGDDNGVVLNYRYLLEGLNSVEGEGVKIEVIDGNTPCLIKPEKDDGYLYVIMPIKQ